FPLPVNDFKEYVLTIPEVAPKLPQGLAEMFMRLVVPDPAHELVGIITQAMEPPSPDHARLVFDIDVFKICRLKATDPNLWRIITDLRDFKNDIFFGSLTQKAIDLYK